MELLKDITVVGKALLINGNSLVVSDLHIGYEEKLRQNGLSFPIDAFKTLSDKLYGLVSRYHPTHLVLNGDIKHEFGGFNREEWIPAMKLLEGLSKKTKIILIRGNHDTVLPTLAKKIRQSVFKHWKIKDTLVCHGDIVPEDEELINIKRIIIGHAHPFFKLTEDGRTEKFPCYLVGKFRKSEIIFQPAFNSLSSGVDVTTGLKTPFFSESRDIEVFPIAGDEVFDFGPLGAFN